VHGYAQKHHEKPDVKNRSNLLEIYLVSICEFHSSHKTELHQVQIRDRQLALAIGVPMVINDLDCDVEELTFNDFQMSL
jgi:hypothetical protein